MSQQPKPTGEIYPHLWPEEDDLRPDTFYNVAFYGAVLLVSLLSALVLLGVAGFVYARWLA